MARARRTEPQDQAGDVLEELYAVPPEEFVAERTRLSRALKDEGRSAEAADVGALKRPSLPVFVANRLARERPREMEELVQAAERLSAAHKSGDAGDLLDAQSRLGDALRTLVREAESAAGRPVSESVAQRLAATLRAAAVDPDTAARLRRGVLADELEPTGFDALLGMPLPPPQPKAKERAKTREELVERRPSRAEEARRARIERIENDLREARNAVLSAEKAYRAAERELTRARQRVGDLEARLEREQARAV